MQQEKFKLAVKTFMILYSKALELEKYLIGEGPEEPNQTLPCFEQMVLLDGLHSILNCSLVKKIEHASPGNISISVSSSCFPVSLLKP